MNHELAAVRAALLGVALAFSIMACGNSNSGPAPRPSANLETVEFALDWSGPQYIGFYVARSMGYYADRGLDVKLLPGAGSTASAKAILDGSIPFGTVSATAMIREIVEAAGPGGELPASLPTIEAVIFPHSPSVILTGTQRSIGSPQDLSGMTIGYTSEVAEAYRQFREFLALQPGLEEQITLEALLLQGTQPLRSGRIDAMVNYIMDAPPTLELEGFDYNATLLHELGFDVPSQCVVVGPGASIDPQTVRDFVEATCEGWEYVRRNPETAAKLFDKALPGQNPDKTLIVARHTLDFLPPAKPTAPARPYTDPEARASAFRKAVDVILNARDYPWPPAQREEIVGALVAAPASEQARAD